MHRVSVMLAFAAVLLAATNGANAAERVAEFRGTGNTTTAIFRVESPWLIDWRLDGDYDQLMALDVTLIEARSGRHVGRVVHAKHRSNGLKMFRSAGLYQLRISSTLARWTVKIDQITPEEAAAYSPK